MPAWLGPTPPSSEIPSPPSTFIQTESELEGLPTPQRVSPHCIHGEGTHRAAQEIAGRDEMIRPPSQLSTQLCFPRVPSSPKPPPASPAVCGSQAQSRLANGSRSLKPGKTPAGRSSMHFTSPRHSPSVLLVKGQGSPLPSRLVSKLPFLERAQGPERS